MTLHDVTGIVSFTAFVVLVGHVVSVQRSKLTASRRQKEIEALEERSDFGYEPENEDFMKDPYEFH